MVGWVIGALLAVFRPRSRHTADFLPKQDHDLGLFELEQVVGKNISLGPRLPLDAAFPASIFYRFERPADPQDYSRLVDRASQCSLLFGLYDEEFCNMTSDIQSVSILDFPQATSGDLISFLQTRDLVSGKKGLAVFAPSLHCAPEQVYLCRPLARGIAAPLRPTGQVLDPLADLLAERRPRSGILKTFALSRMAHTALTSMEPELALLMANLSGVDASTTTILDPFVGAGLILLAAAMLTPDCSMIGSDINPEAAKWVQDNFLQFNLKKPTVLAKDVGMLNLNLAPKSIDCIITDPPYDLKAKINGDYETVILLPLLRLAHQTLKTNGRLVFYSPRAPPTAQQLETSAPGLQVVRVFEQTLSPTFSRFLCVIQKT